MAKKPQHRETKAKDVLPSATKQRPSDFDYMLKLKEIEQPLTLDVHDIYGPHPSEWGDSYLLKMHDSKGKNVGLWLNLDTAAGKSFTKALDAGKLEPIYEGNKVRVHFRPQPVPGTDFTSIRLDFGRVIVRPTGTDDEIPF